MLKIESVTKIYNKGQNNETTALKEVSFEIESRSFTAINGKSGSGKSTLLYLIGGLDDVTDGNIIIDNTDITKLSENKINEFRRQNIGFVFQFFNLVPELTAKENIKLARQISHTKSDPLYYNELITSLELGDRQNHFPGQLSGGQKQRVAIARALISKPKLLLLDEPTGNLDSSSSDLVIEMLHILKERFDQTVIIVTHDRDIAMTADRIITLGDGMVASDEVHSDV